MQTQQFDRLDRAADEFLLQELCDQLGWASAAAEQGQTFLKSYAKAFEAEGQKELALQFRLCADIVRYTSLGKRDRVCELWDEFNQVRKA